MNRKNVTKARIFILVITLLLSVMAGCSMNDTKLTETNAKEESASKTESIPKTESEAVPIEEASKTESMSELISESAANFPSDSMMTGSSENSPIQFLSYDGNYPQHEAYGTGIGAMPGRVVWAHNPDSVDWDGSGYWWEISHFDEAVILEMVNAGIASLGGKDTAEEGWNTLFAAHKNAHNMDGGYTKGEKITIKANINGSAVFDDDTSGATQMSYTNPVLLKTLLISLVKEAGVNPADITEE